MASSYEFASVNLRGRIVLYGIRFFVVLMSVIWAWDLAVLADRETGSLLSSAGALFTGFYVYSNVSRAKHEIQELFVPPYQVDAGWEFLLIGLPCMIAGNFV